MQLVLPAARRAAIEHAARASPAPPVKTTSIVAWMGLAILAIGLVALWDEERESAAALKDFGEEQAGSARASAAALVAQLQAVDATARDLAAQGTLPARDAAGLEVSAAESDLGPASAGKVLHAVRAPGGPALLARVPVAGLLQALRRVEQPGAVRVLLKVPGEAGFRGTTGEAVRSPPLEAALARGDAWSRLERADAAALGLPQRIAMAGLAPVEVGDGGPWGVAVVTSAVRERDREARATLRLILSFSLATGLVLGFGGLAGSKQKKELALARHLALAEAARARDEELVRADKLATLGALGTGIAHEVATPLGVIVALGEQLLPRLDADPRAHRSVKAILQQADRISRVIRAFLGLARGGAPALERVTPGSVARAAMDLVEHRFARAQVKLVTRVDERLPLIACDPRLFEQALVNLLLNACDACQPGGTVELVVSGDRDRVGFIVLDDGAGIPPDAVQRVTQPFFTTKPEGQGSGLGLAIASEIVKHHHGALSLSPRATGPGTRAVIELDVAERGHVQQG